MTEDERETLLGMPAVQELLREEREACAKIVLAGGDGIDRLETAIRLGTNAAIAEAILARGETDVTNRPEEVNP